MKTHVTAVEFVGKWMEDEADCWGLVEVEDLLTRR
jgi:hypothetical protein